MNETNLGAHFSDHRKNCTCDECTIEKLEKRVNELLAEKIAQSQSNTTLQSRIAQLEAERDCMREALEMIAGKKACLDMTLSNIGIANAALYRTTRRG